MKTFKVVEEADILGAVPSHHEPEIIVSTDFDEIGIIPTKVDNFGMMQAIEAVGMLTNCVINSCRRA